MIKLVYAVRRRDDITSEQFHRYWRDSHGPLVRSFQEALAIRRYVQVHRLETPLNAFLRDGRGTLEPFDGVAELWFDNLEAVTAGGATSAGTAAGTALLEDEAHFIDFSRSSIWLGEETEIIA